MQKTLHQRNDIDRQHVSRKEEGRGLVGIEDCVDASIRGLEDYIKTSQERIITAANNSIDWWLSIGSADDVMNCKTDQCVKVL